MSNVPAPLPQGLEEVEQAQQVTKDNPQGERATPASPPKEDRAETASTAPAPVPPMPRLTPGRPAQVPSPSGDEALLFGPSTRPSEPVGTGASMLHKPQPPQHLGKYIPALRAAIQDPEASPLLVNLYQLLAHHLGE